jgi:hypothetical protein
MHLDLSILQGPELHLEVPGQQEPVLLLDVNFVFLKSWDTIHPLKGFRNKHLAFLYRKSLILI